MYILSVIRKALEILRGYSFKSHLLLQFFFLVSALVQVLGVASIAPFIGILSNPEIIQTNEYLSLAYTYFGYTDKVSFIVSYAYVTIVLIVSSSLISGVTLWLTFRFSVGVGEKVQRDLYKNYLYRGYLFHKTNNYNDTIALISQEANRFVYLVLMPFLIFTSHILMAVIILAVLFFVDYKIAISSGLIVGVAYLLTYFYLRKFLSRHGKVVTQRNSDVQAILSESFIGIKDLKIRSLEDRFLHKFASINKRGLISLSLISLAGDIPKLVVESITFAAILFLAVVLLTNDMSTDKIVSILSLYAVAGYKLLPTMQQIYKAMTNISANGEAASRVFNALNESVEICSDVDSHKFDTITNLKLVNASFSYGTGPDLTIHRMNVEFTIGTLNTIVGPSGSGKTTLVDLLMGLLPLKEGHLIVDGRTLARDELLGFKKNVSYVPQHVYLSNEDVISNVAFGVDRNDVVLERVQQALKNANAMEFVNKLSNGMKTSLGQSGHMLSGGQRQKIGIARALYQEAPLLVLDEPTSALDIESEYEIMQVLHKLKKEILIIVISHRPAAIKMSDNIALVKDGKVLDQGSYDMLMDKNNDFRLLIKKSKTE